VSRFCGSRGQLGCQLRPYSGGVYFRCTSLLCHAVLCRLGGIHLRAKGGGGGIMTHAAQLGFTLLQRCAFLLLACERRGQHLRAVCQAGGSRWELRCKGDASEPREVALVRGTGYGHGAVCRH
jgi:hypothetical protein